MKAYVFIPGIFNRPEDENGWTDRAVRYVAALEKKRSKKHGQKSIAVAYEYYSGALFRRMGQADRARQVATIASNFSLTGLDVVLVGHSNGSDIICRSFAFLHPDAEIYEIHLIASAADADMNKNGLNDALARGQVTAVTAYCSKKDEALGGPAKWSKWLGGIFGLGYGQMGLVGLKNTTNGYRQNTREEWNNKHNHNSWVGSGLDATLKAIVE